MDWEKVAASLLNEYHSLTERADKAFGGDFVTQREMRTRAMIAFMFADALRAGMVGVDAVGLRQALEPFANVPPGGYGETERLLVVSAGNGPYHFLERDLAHAKAVFRREG